MTENERGAWVPDPHQNWIVWMDELEWGDETPESELELLVPSRDVREYIRKTGWVITDEQKATLLANSDLSLKKKYDLLRKLRENTPDERLREKLGEYLADKEQEFRCFQRNDDHRFIYTLEVDEPDVDDPMVEGFFFDWALAVDYGKRKKLPFVVKKHLIATEPGLTCVHTGYLNPHLGFPNEKVIEEYEEDYEGDAVGALRFTRDGEANYLWSEEAEDADKQEYLRKLYDLNGIENLFFAPPNPFEHGDIVRLVGKEEYGIVRTSQAEWQEFVTHRKSFYDFSDASLIVEFLTKDGSFSHEHINPVHLELYRPACGDWATASPRDRLLETASLLLQGKGSLEALDLEIECYRRAKDPGAAQEPRKAAGDDEETE